MRTPVYQDQHAAFTSLCKTLRHSSSKDTHTHTEQRGDLGRLVAMGEGGSGGWLVGDGWLGEVCGAEGNLFIIKHQKKTAKDSLASALICFKKLLRIKSRGSFSHRWLIFNP